MDSSRLERIPPSDGNGVRRRLYRPASEGIREVDPRPKPGRAIMLTERVAPSIRNAVGWLYPLEHYDTKLSLDPLSQYAELLLIMGSKGPVEHESLDLVLKEARDRLTDPEFDKLRGYVSLISVGHVGVAPPMPMGVPSGRGP